jgi:Domain of unknown function (DUF4440)
MSSRFTFVLCLLLLFAVQLPAQQSGQDDVLETTRSWPRGISSGDRAELITIMDPRFVATTPAGDVLAKDRLVPNDSTEPVQQLPIFELDGSTVRVYSEAAIVMARLKSASDPAQTLDGTFVYVKQGNSLRLIAVHLSPHK